MSVMLQQQQPQQQQDINTMETSANRRNSNSENSSSSSDNDNDQRRNGTLTTKHRQSLLRIHNDNIITQGSQRHVVPEPSSSSSTATTTFTITSGMNGSTAGNMGRRWSSTSSIHNNNVNNINNSTSGTRMRRTPNVTTANANTAGTDSEDDGDPEEWVHRHGQIARDVLCCSSQRNSSSNGNGRGCLDWWSSLIPMVAWLQVYQWKRWFVTDIMAGLTVAVMIVPQSMSYAKLAGLPVQFGLYSSLVPIYAYAVFGSSRQLGVGPVALVSLLLSTGLTMILEQDGITPETTDNYDAIYATLALQTSVLVGISYIGMGILRLGFVTIFLSHAVISGFTSGAAIIIGLSQLKYIFGYDIPNDKSLHKMLGNIFSNIDQFNWKTFLLGTACIFTLMGMKKMSQKYPQRFKWTRAAGPLVVTVVSIVLQVALDLQARGIPIVGHIPKGLPKFTGSAVFPLTEIHHLSVVVLSIVLVGFMESIAIAKTLAQKHNYELDSSSELIGLGVANLMSGLFGGYPVCGSFSRSAVNNDSGAMSGISAIVTATVVALVLLFLTPVFELLPLATLAAIVISGVISLVDYPEAIYLWKVHKFDFGVWMCAFLGTLFLGVELGLGISVGISILLVLYESAYPPTAVLGRLPGTHQYRNVKQYPGVETYDGIVCIRIDAPIYFANTQHIREKVQKYYRRAQEQLSVSHHQQDPEEGQQVFVANEEPPKVQFVVLDMSPVAHVDTSALHTLQDITSSFRKNDGVQLCLSNPNPRVMHRLVKSGLADDIGRDHIFVSLHDAVNYCLSHMDAKELESMHAAASENTARELSDDTKTDDDLEVGAEKM